MPFQLVVNGIERTVDAPPEMPLLWVLRDVLNLTGTKYGCGIGQCGACTVHLDGAAIRSCTISAATAAGKQVTTIEGLSPDRDHPLQRAWLAEHVPQCGYCQAGQLMQAAAFLEANPNPSAAEVDAAMAGNLCRCGTYQRLRQAILRAAKEGTNG